MPDFSPPSSCEYSPLLGGTMMISTALTRVIDSNILHSSSQSQCPSKAWPHQLGAIAIGHFDSELPYGKASGKTSLLPTC
jgi:hypothetical protein